MKRRGFLAAAAVPALAPLLAACSGDSKNQLEIFSWWTGPGEEEGLAKLIKMFKEKYKGVDFKNSAVAGGGGDKAKGKLAARLASHNPPDSFQAHVGAEMFDYVDNKVLDDLTSFIKDNKFNDVLHPATVKNMTQKGKMYAIPVDVHRANLLWFNPSVLEKANVEPPKTWEDLISQNAKFKKAKLITLATGAQWTLLQLLETVLLGQLKADSYRKLFNGGKDWTESDVVAALNVYADVLKISDMKHHASDWQPQLDKVDKGTAAYAVVGDWAYAYLATAKKRKYKEDYDVVVTPGSDGMFDFLADAFTLPSGAPHPDNCKKWLKVVASKEGQIQFSLVKGSLPARKDVDASEFKDYQAWNSKQWTDPKTEVVPSLAHGAAAGPAWSTKITDALGEFTTGGKAKDFAAKVQSAYEKSQK
ncbi:MAG TPA: extracellular solute-binding protein [Stackebrandtia sp.]|uniref:ABC transporter substrate-binding protein n=1 Tax=Stackebrandtia sp. TaxID=2023065 RepID=UPI002D2EEF49|nr:extracellular solute-binding protein [Stackebrandtia sp.]HZE38943.1 extracellular solute-binding protein [Stackebrandtia sp.]